MNPGIEEAIGKVGRKVHDNHDKGVDNDHPLQQRIVALAQGGQDQFSKAWPGEDDFGQYRVTDQDAQIKADNCRDRNKAVSRPWRQMTALWCTPLARAVLTKS